MNPDEFHPALHHVPADALVPAEPATPGIDRFTAISGATTGSKTMWMGQARVHPHNNSGNHHHGESETAIYVVSGAPEFVFIDPETGAETRLTPAPGDFVYVPPFTPHREENNHPEVDAVVVLARSTQEAIVIPTDTL
jgi:uncharacterized RmlC-like cupin family protein